MLAHIRERTGTEIEDDAALAVKEKI